MRELLAPILLGALVLAAPRPLVSGPGDSFDDARTASAPVKPRPSSARRELPERVRDAIERGVDHLLSTQRRDGSWGSATTGRIAEVLAQVPGSHRAFRAGTTALCVMALARSPVRDPESRAAVLRGLEFLLEEGRIRRPNGLEMYNVWAFAYALQAIGELLGEVDDEALGARMVVLARELIAALELYQTPDGGWGYYDFELGSYRPSDSSMSFTTATVLIALQAVEKEGVVVPAALVEKAVRSIRRCRKEDGSFIYGTYARYLPSVGYNEIKGSLGRTQACHLALRAFTDDVSDDDLRHGIELFFRHHHFMDIGRKRPRPHEAWYYTSGYYYFYGVFHARKVLDLLPGPAVDEWRRRLHEILLARQESDGSWWDFPLYGYYKAYGTAYALLTLFPGS